jgi:hypothetical protein
VRRGRRKVLSACVASKGGGFLSHFSSSPDEVLFVLLFFFFVELYLSSTRFISIDLPTASLHVGLFFY